MDWSIACGVLGILATVVFGIWGVILMVRRKYPGQLTFIKELNIPLFDAIVKDLPELSVKFMDKPVPPTLVLLKGAIINTGTIDISESMVEEQLKLTLPEGYKWHTAKVIGCSKNVKADINIQTADKISIMHGLLRKNEFIHVQAVAELPIENDKNGKKRELDVELYEKLRFEHRIADTGKIRKMELEVERDTKRFSKALLVMLFVGIILTSITTALYFTGNIPSTFIYKYTPENGDTILVKTTAIRKNFVTIKGVNIKFKKKVEMKTFKKDVGICVDTIYEKDFIIPMGMSIAYLILPGVLILLSFQKNNRNKKIKEMLRSNIT